MKIIMVVHDTFYCPGSLMEKQKDWGYRLYSSIEYKFFFQLRYPLEQFFHGFVIIF